MDSICNANCKECYFKDQCKGCAATCGHPFGGRCVAAEYIRFGGMAAYHAFKEKLLSEVNALLAALALPEIRTLFELPGSYVNLTYTLPNGESVKFLNEQNVYLGAQIELDGGEICCGAVADTDFILICTYGENGSNPELLLYKKR